MDSAILKEYKHKEKKNVHKYRYEKNKRKNKIYKMCRTVYCRLNTYPDKQECARRMCEQVVQGIYIAVMGMVDNNL